MDTNTVRFLKCNGRRISFRYELYDKDSVFKKMLDTVQNCRITYNSLSTLKYSANLTMTEDGDVDYFNDQIRVVCIVKKGSTNMEFPLGMFLISSPGRNIKSNSITRSIDMYSRIQILNDQKVESRYFVQAGVNIVSEVIRLLGTHLYRISPSSKTTAVSREWEIGTPYITVINDLLDSINYTSLRVGADGYFEATPYVLPQDREVEIEYMDDIDSVLSPDMNDELDLFDVPNVFVRYTNNAEGENIVSRYENTNPESPTSIPSRGRRIVSCESVEAADISALTEITRRAASDASQVYNHVTFSTAIMPIHSYMNALFLRHKEIISGRYIETSWELECKAGAMMSHTARRIINV